MTEAKSHGLRHKLTRSAAVALALAGTALGGGSNPQIEKSSKPILIETPPLNSENIDGVTINYSQDGLPVSYKVYDKMYEISPIEVEKMRLLRKKAQENQEPQLLLSIPGEYVGPQGKSWQTSPDRPLIDEMPPDVLSETELKKHGITEIIQGQQVKLFIRKEAFEAGGILYDLSRAQKLKAPVKLRIVLVDGPAVAADYMGNPKYDDVRTLGYLRNEGIDDFRKKQIDESQAGLDIALKNLHIAQSNKDQKAIYLTSWQAIAFKNQIDNYQNATYEELTEKINLMHTEAAGVYWAPTGINEKGEQVATVLIAVGSTLPVQEKIKFFVGPDGKIVQIEDLGIETYSFNYQADDSKGFPRSSDFKFNPKANKKNNGYPYGAQNNEAGFTLTHELTHLNKITLRPLLDHVAPDNSEYDTDMEAMKQIDKEYNKWLKGGTNKQKNPYPFVFKEGGSYQVTKNELGSGPSEPADKA